MGSVVVLRPKLVVPGHISLDIETLGTTTIAPVIEVGLVSFDTDGPIKALGVRLDLEEQFRQGRRPTQATIEWWMSGGAGDAAALFREPGVELRKGLGEINDFIRAERDADGRVWSKGPRFDGAIYLDLNQRAGNRTEPYPFWADADVRTAEMAVERLGGKWVDKDIEPAGEHRRLLQGAGYQMVKHRGVFDAYVQALQVAMFFVETSSPGTAAAEATAREVASAAGADFDEEDDF